MFVLTTCTQTTVQHTIDVECHTEWVTTVTPRCESKVTCNKGKVMKNKNMESPYWFNRALAASIIFNTKEGQGQDNK